jgi:hypothetical protein
LKTSISNNLEKMDNLKQISPTKSELRMETLNRCIMSSEFAALINNIPTMKISGPERFTAKF